MACFLISAAEAAVVTAVEKRAEKKENEEVRTEEFDQQEELRIPLSRKLRWLTYLLWGGAVLLMFEHIWHGEIVPWFPFITAMSDPGDAAQMLHEMATVGVSMAGLITAVWAVICRVADSIIKRPSFEKVHGSTL